MLKHQEHIVCVPSSVVKHRENGFVDYTLKAEDVVLVQRAKAEQDDSYRQIIPVNVFTHGGKVWAYKRTPSGGEERLHGGVTCCVGGHFDVQDIFLDAGSTIDISVSLSIAESRELEEEVDIRSEFMHSYTLPKMICCDDTEVDRHHMCIVTIHELAGTDMDSKEDQLESLGFVDPVWLLDECEYTESWGKMVAKLLINL